MRPRFQPRQVDSYVPAIRRHTERLLDEWKAGDKRDIPLDMSHLTLRIACDTLFGVGELEVRDALLCALIDRDGSRSDQCSARKFNALHEP